MNRTMDWVKANIHPEGGIRCVPGGKPYPEVSGYFIPTLFDYGESEIGLSVADWLLEIQEDDGSFRGLDGKVRGFDTGACMEGLGRAFQETQDPRYQDGASRAWDWLVPQGQSGLQGMRLEDGTLRVVPESKKTHLYMLRVNGLMGDGEAAKVWKQSAWPVTRVHYAAYALEGLWMLGETGFVMAQLLLARNAITDTGLMPYEAGSSWRSCSGTDTCATAQMAILYHQAGSSLAVGVSPQDKTLGLQFVDDALRLRAGVEGMVQEDGGIRLGKDYAECNSWTVKWALDMWKILGHG